MLKRAAKANLTAMDLNYPAHFIDCPLRELTQTLEETGISLNGLAMRYYSEASLKLGAFTNPSSEIRRLAIDQTKKGIDTLKFCDEISKTFKDLTKTLNLTNDDFIRTTEERHKKTVQHLWKELEKNDDIYLSNYSGWYSVSDEAFYNDDEIEEVDGKKIAISSKSPVEFIEEESYFFRLSKWEKSLLDYYEANPDFISPQSRKNEVINFVESGLKDLSVSRKSFSWGIPVPNNKEHVIYVW